MVKPKLNESKIIFLESSIKRLLEQINDSVRSEDQGTQLEITELVKSVYRQHSDPETIVNKLKEIKLGLERKR